MAKKQESKSAPKQTVRQRASKEQAKAAKPRRLKQGATTAKKPIKSAFGVGKKEFYVPLPNNRLGRFLNKKRHFIPKYFRDSWAELKQVTWPNRKQTAKLSLAVIMFAVVFALLISVVDFGLDKLFRQLIL
jgi:preprotein translocase SecE subunit